VDLDLVFLGTSGSMPTAQRAPAALLLRRGGERLLFDCAEGTQRQMLRSNVGLIELREIFLTHYHADHYLGLPGMLKTFALRGREVPITVYGPPGLRDLFEALRRIFGRLTYTVELKELRAGDEALVLFSELSPTATVDFKTVAAPIFDPIGRVLLSLSITGPEEPASAGRVRELGRRLVQAAAIATRQSRGRPPAR